METDIKVCGEHFYCLPCPKCAEQPDDRAARLARIDETARAVFAASFNGVDLLSCNWSDTVIDLRCRVAYEFALALERARDEAVKELDALPSKEPR